MQILFWVPYPTEGASNRYRVEQYLPYLNNAGIGYSLHPFWSKVAYKYLYKKGYIIRKMYYFIWGVISRFLDLLLISRYNLVFVHRQASPIGDAFFANILGALRKPFIFDFDDAIFIPSASKSNIFMERFKSQSKVINIIKKSKFIIAGNTYLANFALRYSPYVSIVTTPIDTDKYFPHQHTSNKKKVIIGWMGSNTTIEFLGMLENVFRAVAKKFNNIIFKVVGGSFTLIGLSNIISKPWSLDEEIEDLQSFDIGIMPLPDNDWTKGKCGFKAILYMSMGIPCVCSRVGFNKEIVSDGFNSFLAETEQEWLDKISILIENPQLRKKIGMEARKTVEENFSVKANVAKILEIIHKSLS